MRPMRPLRSLPHRIARAAAVAAASAALLSNGAGDTGAAVGYDGAARPSALAHAANARVTPEHLSGEIAVQGKSTIGNIR
jgi:hypothetical protein